MDEFLLKLKIIEDLLENKKVQLNNILNITLNQQEILLYTSKSDEISSFFSQMNKEKQSCIEEIINIDQVFQQAFEKTKDELNEKSHLHRDKVLYLQSLIKDVTDLDVNIKIQEDKNKALLRKPSMADQGSKIEKKEFVSKSNLLKKYKENNDMKIESHIRENKGTGNHEI